MAIVLISVGSNIDRTQNTRAARLALEGQFAHVECSSVYESAAVGFDGDPFYNWVAKAETKQNVEQVCACLKRIERENGRVTSDKKFSARTLDLDLLTYDNRVISHPVTLPREEILYNAFVLRPLAELVPNDLHPSTKRNYASLWQSFDQLSQQITPIDFEWSSN